MSQTTPLKPRTSVRIPTLFSPPDTLDEEKNEAVAYIDSNMESQSFNPEDMGLIYDTSYSGCGLVMVTRPGTEAFRPDTRVKLKLGILHPISATIRWRKDVDEKFFTLGLEYNE